ncbi:MAG: hypothetical protein V5A62_01860 [Haloarculaceae archaeon]
MEVEDRELLNGTVTTGEEVVVRVDLANFHPARGRITLNLTADGTLVARKTVTVGVDERRTVYLRAVPNEPGQYELRLDGVSVGTVTVTAADGSATASSDPSTGSSPTAETTPDAVAPTPGATSTDWETPTGTAGTRPSTSAEGGTRTGTGTATPAVGPDDPTGTDAVVAAGMSLMLLYGVGVAVYVLREHPPSGLG